MRWLILGAPINPLHNALVTHLVTRQIVQVLFVILPYFCDTYTRESTSNRLNAKVGSGKRVCLFLLLVVVAIKLNSQYLHARFIKWGGGQISNATVC